MASADTVKDIYKDLGLDKYQKDSSGYDYWTGKIESGEISAEDAKSQISAAAKGLLEENPSLPTYSDRDVVENIYTNQDLHKYQEDDKGYQFWENKLASGELSRADAATEIAKAAAAYQFPEEEKDEISIAPPQPTKPRDAVANLGVVDPNTMTVEGRLKGLLEDEDNPLMQRAKAQGLQQAAQRGLANSSLGVEAAQAAMIDAALPIAQQDASTYYDQNKVNQAAKNQFEMFNVDFENQDYFRSVDFLNKLAVDAANNDAALERLGADIASREYIAQNQLDFQTMELAFNASLQKELQAGEIDSKNAEAFTTQYGNLSQQYQIQQTAIATDPGLAPAEKNRALRDLFVSYQADANVMAAMFGVNIDWSAQEDTFVNEPAETTTEETTTEETTTEETTSGGFNSDSDREPGNAGD